MPNLTPPMLARDMPLKGATIEYDGLKITPVEDTGMFMMQKSVAFDETNFPPHSGFLQKLNKSLPEFGKCAQYGDVMHLSVTPISWLSISTVNQAQILDQVFQESNSVNGLVITDMSDQYMQFNFSGKYTRNLLAKGCELDLSPDAFAPFSCSRTLLAHLNVVIWRGGAENLSLFIDVSYAEHLWLWLQGAAKEYSK